MRLFIGTIKIDGNQQAVKVSFLQSVLPLIEESSLLI